MKTFIGIFFSVFFVFSISAEASWSIKVNHPEIFQIMVERNVISPFHQSSNYGTSYVLINQLKANTIHHNFNDHPMLDHHTNSSVAHAHIVFEKAAFITPEILNAYLVASGFSEKERDRIQQAFTSYFHNSKSCYLENELQYCIDANSSQDISLRPYMLTKSEKERMAARKMQGEADAYHDYVKSTIWKILPVIVVIYLIPYFLRWDGPKSVSSFVDSHGE